MLGRLRWSYDGSARPLGQGRVTRLSVIVWDRDDVLIDLMGNWLERWWKPVHPACRTQYEELTENPPHRIIGITLDEYLASLDEFRLSKLAAELQPVSEVLEWFQKFGDGHRHIALSATPLETAPSAAAWTFRHFGAWIRSFHMVPSPRPDTPIRQYDDDKTSYIRWLGHGDVLVDDSPTNIAAAERLGIAGISIPRPWNGEKGEVVDAMDRLLKLPNMARP